VTDPDAASPADPYAGFPPGFFSRDDERPDALFYGPPRLVTHIDDAAIAAVGDLYAELGIDGSSPVPRRVLDLMSSWISHFRTPPAELVVLGMNAAELAANAAATQRIVRDLNTDPTLPLPDRDVDAAVCCVSIDYLTRPVEVLAEAGRVLRPGGPLTITYSDRCFPTKAVRGWLATTDEQHGALVAELVRRTGMFGEPEVSLRTRPGRGDPLHAVVARRR
jgi:SAM-dependent methyltransferase